MRKNTVFRWLALALAGGMLAGLAACASKGVPAKAESEILQDVEENDVYYSDYNLEISASNIIKRQTNPEDKADYVWIEVSAFNYDFTYTATYAISYSLYNDGWLADEVVVENSSYVANHPESVSQEQADEAITRQGYGPWEFIGREESENAVLFEYAVSTYECYMKTTQQINVIYTFTPYEGWVCQVTEGPISRDLDVLGEWRYQDNSMGEDFYVNILSVDTQEKEITLEYSIANYHGKSYTSNGVVTLYLWELNENNWDIDVDGFLFQVTAGKLQLKIPGDYGCGVFVGSHWLTRQT